MKTFERIAIVTITKEGAKCARRLKKGLPASAGLRETQKIQVVCFDGSKGRLKEHVEAVFDKRRFDGIIFVMAVGIVVRMIAARLKNKYRDPAVVAVDDFGRYAISILSGHEGGANSLAVMAGNILDAEPVITTASETTKDTVIGIGCRKGIKKEEVLSSIKKILSKIKCPLTRVRCLATVDLKAKEKGLREAARALDLPLRVISRKRIKYYQGAYEKSAFVLKKIGVEGVCEPCALLAGIRAHLVAGKTKHRGLTLAVAREN